MKNQAILGLLGIALVGSAGCAHNSTKTDTTTPSMPAQATEDKAQPSLEMAHFPYDSAKLTAYGKQVIQRDAQQLKKDPSLTVEVQGYCDDRGTVAYNVQLGERRAESVKKYLEELGVSADRITTKSFGKMDPLDSNDNERAWAKNRRAAFVVGGHSDRVALQ